MWVISLAAGLLLGWVLTLVAPAQYPDAAHAEDAGVQVTNDHATPDHARPIEIASAGDDLDHTGITLPDDAQHDPASSEESDHAAPEHDDAHAADHHGPSPTIPLWLVIPFALLLGSIALMPFINERAWHHHFPDFAFFLGGITLAYYLIGFSQPGYSHGMTYGEYQMTHVGLEYYSFIALIGGLFVASGGIHIDVQGRGRPMVNTAILAIGAVIANIVGTTGASVLLIRPFMRVNKGRLKPIHVVMFIFIVSNCGGALTPIGDPPLYLGFLKGVPFEWTLLHLWPMWATCIGLLLAVFFAIDTRIGRGESPDSDASRADADNPQRLANPDRVRVRISGTSGIIALGLIIFGVFIDPMLKSFFGISGFPFGATFQILVAIGAHAVASRENLKANEFNFFPVKEVGLLFVGIFTTMAPALGYLASHGAELGLDSPTKFFFGTGLLSGVLDNAPTYLNFLQVAFAAQDLDLNPDNVHAFLDTSTGIHDLVAISLGAVFFGAMTYIGNGPNFMVKAIAESSGLRMPSFFGYFARALVILFPVLLVVWFIFVR